MDTITEKQSVDHLGRIVEQDQKIEEQQREIERLNQSISDLEHEVKGLENDRDALETKLEMKRQEPLDYQVLQLKHPRLFTGDLSRLTHADRRELFEEIYNSEGHSDALSSIEHRIS